MNITSAYQRLQRASTIIISDELVFSTPEDYILQCINATQYQLGLRPVSDVVARAFWTDPHRRKHKLSGAFGFKGDPHIWWSIYHTYDTPDARYFMANVRPDADKAILRFRHLGKKVHIVSSEVDSIARAQTALIDENITCWSVSNGEPMGGCFNSEGLGAILALDGCHQAPEQAVIIGGSPMFALSAYSRKVGFVYFQMGVEDVAVSMFADAGIVGRWDHILLAFSRSD